MTLEPVTEKPVVRSVTVALLCTQPPQNEVEHENLPSRNPLGSGRRSGAGVSHIGAVPLLRCIRCLQIPRFLRTLLADHSDSAVRQKPRFPGRGQVVSIAERAGVRCGGACARSPITANFVDSVFKKKEPPRFWWSPAEARRQLRKSREYPADIGPRSNRACPFFSIAFLPSLVARDPTAGRC